MKGFLVLFVILFLSTCPPGFSEVLFEQKIKVSEFRIFSKENYPQVLLSFVPGNIHFLDEIELVVDNERRVIGVNLYYRLGDGFRRKVFIQDFNGWMIKYPKDGFLFKEITVRVLTPDELFKF